MINGSFSQVILIIHLSLIYSIFEDFCTSVVLRCFILYMYFQQNIYYEWLLENRINLFECLFYSLENKIFASLFLLLVYDDNQSFLSQVLKIGLYQIRVSFFHLIIMGNLLCNRIIVFLYIIFNFFLSTECCNVQDLRRFLYLFVICVVFKRFCTFLSKYRTCSTLI